MRPEDENSILAVLSLALVLPELMERLSPSLRFSRLILVYLCDTVYLNEDVSALLLRVMSDLLQRHHAELNFTIQVPGISSFTDLFTALCEEFCASCYGYDVFAMTLLVPLAQRHDVHYRKMLWSEHAVAVRYLRLPREKLVQPLTEYLYPEEEDTSLIKNYITALVRGTVRETWCPVGALYDCAASLGNVSETLERSGGANENASGEAARQRPRERTVALRTAAIVNMKYQCHHYSCTFERINNRMYKNTCNGGKLHVLLIVIVDFIGNKV